MRTFFSLAIALIIAGCSQPHPPAPPIPVPVPPVATTFKLDGATITIEGSVNAGVTASAEEASRQFEVARDLLDKL